MSLQKPDFNKVLEGAETTMEDLDQLHEEQKVEEDYRSTFTMTTVGMTHNLLYGIKKALREYSRIHTGSGRVLIKKGDEVINRLKVVAKISTSITDEKVMSKAFDCIFCNAAKGKTVFAIQKDVEDKYPGIKVVSITTKTIETELREEDF